MGTEGQRRRGEVAVQLPVGLIPARRTPGLRPGASGFHTNGRGAPGGGGGQAGRGLGSRSSGQRVLEGAVVRTPPPAGSPRPGPVVSTEAPCSAWRAVLTPREGGKADIPGLSCGEACRQAPTLNPAAEQASPLSPLWPRESFEHNPRQLPSGRGEDTHTQSRMQAQQGVSKAGPQAASGSPGGHPHPCPQAVRWFWP